MIARERDGSGEVLLTDTTGWLERWYRISKLVRRAGLYRGEYTKGWGEERDRERERERERVRRTDRQRKDREGEGRLRRETDRQIQGDTDSQRQIGRQAGRNVTTELDKQKKEK